MFLEEVSRSRQRNRDILLGTWNVRSLYRLEALMAAIRELARERGHWGDPDVDGRIILRWIFRKLEGSWGLDGVGSG